MTTPGAAIEFGLTLRPAAASASPAAAWFVVGDDVATWVAEVCRWGVPLADVRVYPVPASGRTRRACGALVVTAGTPSVVAALPYAVMGGRLFHPAEASVVPPVSAAELAAALRHDVVVLHPSAGWVGFAAEDGLTVGALLAPPPRRAADWSHADAGPPPLPRLVSVEAEPLPPTLDGLIDGGDIGSAADEVPPGEAEPKPSAFGFIRSLLTGGKGAADQKDKGSLEAKRQRELDRLLALMKTDPDAGLQHALPLRDLATRGVTPPAGTLGRAEVAFNLANLSGGRRKADPWAVANEMRAKLTAEYRAAANREMNLGRHGRAAYIFAHLLGDFAAAADALRQGRQFREAAALYRDHLKNPRAAADCLVAGGLLTEAIPLLWETSQFERAGDLYARLGEAGTAADCYRDAVRQALDGGDPVAAAGLLAGKLAAADEALAVLAQGWPASPAAAACLAEWFALTGRLGRHDDATARLAVLREADVPPGRVQVLVGGLAAVAGSYPNADVRHRAADVTRVLVGRRLGTPADLTDRRAMVRAVIDLAPADKLLARDAARFLQPAAKPDRLKVEPTVVRTFRLPEGHQWRAVVAITGGFLALGVRDGRCTLVRGRWDGQLQARSLARDTAADRAYALLGPGADKRVVLAALAGVTRPGFDSIQLPRMDLFDDDLTVASPAYLGAMAVGACRGENGAVWTWASNEVLASHAPDGRVLASHAAPCPFLDAATAGRPVPMVARAGGVFVAGDRAVFRWSGGPRVRRTDLPGEPRTLVPSLPHRAFRLLVTFDAGFALWRDDGCRPYAEPLVRPVAAFTPDGSVVAVGTGTGYVYRTTVNGELSFADRFDVPATVPAAVLPAGAGRVAVVDADGAVSVCRFRPG